MTHCLFMRRSRSYQSPGIEKNQHSLLLESSDLSDELDSSLVWPRVGMIPWNEFSVGSASSRGDNETTFFVDDESSDGTCDLRCCSSGLFNTERRNLRVSALNAFRRLWRRRLRRTRIIVRMTMLKRSAGTIERHQKCIGDNMRNEGDLSGEREGFTGIRGLRRPSRGERTFAASFALLWGGCRCKIIGQSYLQSWP